MAKLILSMDGLVLKEIPLDRERLTIGRKPNNDVQIDNLAISGQHAVITSILDDAFLEDQNSTNGTYVNGQPIKKHVLRNNDVIELGKYRLKYLIEKDKPGQSKADYIDTAALKPVMHSPETDAVRTASEGAESDAGADATRTRLSDAVAAKPADEPPENRIGRISVLSGANAGRELELSKPLTTLGKPGRQVAVITRRMHGYFITHVEGASFPLVNGQALDAQAHRLEPGDVIEIAGVRMEFSLHD